MNQTEKRGLPSPEAALDSLNALLQRADQRVPDNRRISDRKHVFAPCTVQPLDKDLAEVGFAIAGLTRDASVSGVGFLTADPMTSSLVRLDFEDPTTDPSVILRICHQNRKGSFFSFGGEVAVDWDRS